MKPLTPFATTDLTKSLVVKANFFQAAADLLLIEFTISGPLHLISWPTASGGARENDLWNHTCLEAFFSSGQTEKAPYTEINCSPNGSWNAYAFSSYREGMTPSDTLTVRLKQRESTPQDARFQVEIQSTSPLAIQALGLSAVIEFTGGEKSYWALHHPGSRPDFHSKDGWHHLATR